MKIYNTLLNIILALLFTGVALAQETTLQLPTNDNTSSFNVTKNNGTNILKVDAGGRITGDGSGLSNLKSLLKSTGGKQRFQITANYGSYNNVRSVTFTAPSSGNCLVMASGYVDWESTGWDLLLSSILMDQNPASSYDAEDEWYGYLNILTDYNCPDSSDQFTSFSQHRVIPVTAGTHTFYLWANKHFSASITEVRNVNLTVAFFPSGGTGEAALNISSTYLDDSKHPILEGSVDGVTPYFRDEYSDKLETDSGNVEEKFAILTKENEALRKRLDTIEKMLMEKAQ